MLGEHRLAAADYGGVIALDPGNAGAHLDRARAHAKLEEHRLARDETLRGIDEVSLYGRSVSSRVGLVCIRSLPSCSVAFLP